MMEYPIGNIEEIETLTLYAGEYSKYFVWNGKVDKRIRAHWKVKADRKKSIKHSFWICLTLRDYPGEKASIELSVQVNELTIVVDNSYLCEPDAIERFRFRIGCLLFGFKSAVCQKDEE